MKNQTPSKLENAIGLDFTDKEHIWLSDQETIRAFIGILGMLLPFLLLFFLRIDSGYKVPLESISHYYHTRVSSILVITISFLALFLIIYKGWDRTDFILSLIAGASSLCVALFPTDKIDIESLGGNTRVVVTILRENPFRENFHFIMAAVFLSTLAYMSLFQFTKSGFPKKARSKNKRIRNFLYSLFGILIILSMVVIACGEVFHWIPPEFYFGNHIKFWMEVVALESFGISWLIKSEVILKG